MMGTATRVITNSFMAIADADGNEDDNEVESEDGNVVEVSEMMGTEDGYGEGVSGVVSVVVSR